MPDAEDALAHYVWPGNVREMVNVMERMALLDSAVGPIPLRALSLPPAPFKNSNGQSRFQLVTNQHSNPESNLTEAAAPSTSVNPEEVVQGQSYIEAKKRWSDAFEKEYLCSVLKKHDGNVSAASRESQMDRSNFLRLLRRHGVKAESFRKVGSKQAA